MPVVTEILVLIWLVTTIAIMLVDFSVEEMCMGVDRVTAIVDADHKPARPIVMTAIATVPAWCRPRWRSGSAANSRPRWQSR